MSALLVGGASTFVSCKDYDGDQAAVTNANVKGLSDKLNEQITALEALKTDINSKLSGKADQSVVDALNLKVDNEIADLEGKIADIKQCGECLSLDQLKEIFATQAFVNDINDKLTALLAKNLVTSDQLKDWLTEDDITTLRADMTALNNLFGENLQNAVTKANLADYAKAANLASKDDLENLVSTDELAKYALATDLDSYLKTENFSGQLVSTLNTLLESSGLQNITNVFELFAEIDKIAGMNDSINNLSTRCAQLAGKYSLLNDRIDSLVTSVNVDMVSNPIYGTFNTPFGIKSYVLAGFVGDQIERVNFNGVKVEGLAASADAGNVYLTVNPAEVDAEGWSLNLVGRDGKPAPGFGNLVLVADNTPVTTLSTRASNGLGGYVAAAELEDAAAAKVDIDKDGLKDVAKNVLGKLRGEETLDITNAVRTIYNQIKDFTPQYYAIKCQVNDGKSDGETKTKTYVSDYNIAAVTIKPLSYTTNIGVVGEKYDIPQIPSLQQWLNANIKDFTYDPVDVTKIKDVIVEIPDINQVKVSYDDPTNPNLSGGELSWNIDPSTGTSTNVSINFSKITIKEGDTKAEITVKLDDLRKVVEDLNTQVENMVGDVNKLFDKAESLAGRFDNIASKVNTVISAANKFIDNANQYLQPIMLGVANDGAFRLSEVKDIPTVVKANGENAIILAPTSYTLELLAPAYKKSIKVNGTELNNETLDGATKTVVANLKSGLNEIEYSTMDFYGKVRNKKYYVEVK